MCGTFEAACAAAQKRLNKEREGIGRLQEKRLHATLKFWLDPDDRHHEVRLPGGAVADIFDGEQIIEIQNGNFSGFRNKLTRLLEEYTVTVVYPVVRQKTLFWVDPATGERSPARRSPKKGGFPDAAPELLFIKEQLFHPRLTVRIQLLDVEEYRLLDGWGNGGKRGAHRIERLPTAIGEAAEIRTLYDLRVCLPAGLPTTFTSVDFAKAMRLKKGRRLSAALRLFTDTGILLRAGKTGNRYLYTATF